MELILLDLLTLEKALQNFDQTLVYLVVFVNVGTIIALDWYRNGSSRSETM